MEKLFYFLHSLRGSWVNENNRKQRSGCRTNVILSLYPQFRVMGRLFYSFSRSSKRCATTTLKIQEQARVRNFLPLKNIFFSKYKKQPYLFPV